MVREAVPEDSAEISRLLDEFNLEFEEPSPGVEVIEPRVRRFIEQGPKHFLLASDNFCSLFNSLG